MTVTTHDYVPGAADLRPCATCGQTCAPFPTRESPMCSWCWWLAEAMRLRALVGLLVDVTAEDMRRHGRGELLS